MKKTAAEVPARKNLFFFATVGLVIVLAALVVVGFGLASRAAGGGELQYLEIEAEDAREIAYVIVNQPGVACDNGVFNSGAAVTVGTKVEGAAVETATSICFRAQLDNGNYVYKKYGEPKLRIWISEVFPASAGGEMRKSPPRV